MKGDLQFDGDPLTFFETVPVADYQLQLPFAVRLHQNTPSATPLTADWKEMIRSQWPTN